MHQSGKNDQNGSTGETVEVHKNVGMKDVKTSNLEEHIMQHFK